MDKNALLFTVRDVD